MKLRRVATLARGRSEVWDYLLDPLLSVALVSLRYESRDYTKLVVKRLTSPPRAAISSTPHSVDDTSNESL